MSGIYPPWGSFSLMRASDISQVENSINWEVVRAELDIAVRIGRKRESVCCISTFMSYGKSIYLYMYVPELIQVSVIAGLPNNEFKNQTRLAVE